VVANQFAKIQNISNYYDCIYVSILMPLLYRIVTIRYEQYRIFSPVMFLASELIPFADNLSTQLSNFRSLNSGFSPGSFLRPLEKLGCPDETLPS